MATPNWIGVYPALLTPFNSDESIDEKLFLKNLQAQIDAGVQGVIIGGSLGEASTLLNEEKLLLLKRAKLIAPMNFPIILNIAESTTKAAVAFAKEAEAEGADGFMLLPPMRYKSDDNETVQYFKAVAAATSLSIMIYNNPVDYKIEVTLDMFESLKEYPNIQAVKESTRDVSNVTRMKNRFGDRFKILCGVDTLAYEELCLGADGWIAGLVDAFPEETVAIYRLTKAGKLAEALSIYRWFLPVLELDIHPKLVQYIKLAATHTGIGSPHVRAPRLPLTGEELNKVNKIITSALAMRPKLPDYRSLLNIMATHLQSFSTLKGAYIPTTFPISSEEEVAQAVQDAADAFIPFSKKNFIERAEFLEAIAEEIMELGDALLAITHEETALPIARLTGERGRTCTQLKLYANLLRNGSWCDAVIDTALPDRQPLPRADLRRILQPIGPVLVFGASNFPYAYSTAGGDTASALAAGCPVIVKAHESHLGTSELVAKAVVRAAEKTGMPKGVFASLVGTGPILGQQLAADERIQAIGFTGSYKAGMALYTTATQKRKTPIPVYAEMSSINPVILLPEIMAQSSATIAAALAGSISLGVGQFCTSPGLIFALDNDATQSFAAELATALATISPATMLNPQISNTYYADKKQLANTKNVKIIFEGSALSEVFQATPALMQTTAVHFMATPSLQKEIFGPCSLLVVCKNQDELYAAIRSMEGQLTGSVYGSTNELIAHQELVDSLQQKVGRLIFNNVPTGVEVCNAIVHGGPFPATTDARTTSVGPEAIRRFARPVCYQDCPQALLPMYLRNHNEAGIVRMVNGIFTKESVE